MWKTYENMKTPTFWMDKNHFPNGNHGGLHIFFAFQVKDNLRSHPSQSQAFQVSDSKGKHVEMVWNALDMSRCFRMLKTVIEMYINWYQVSLFECVVAFQV